MKILVTNDDGINAPGLWEAVRALTELGEVFVVAPDRDMSGVGTAMTLTNVVRTEEIRSPVNKVVAYSVQGTPADCVILAYEKLFDWRPDILVSGINRGANLGLDVMVSGTVGGALQGYYRDIPSIAVSVFYEDAVRYDAAAYATKMLTRNILEIVNSPPMLLNVNVPSLSLKDIENVCITKLGPATFLENVERGTDGKRTHYWIKHNRRTDAHVDEDTDVWAVRNHCISITPLDVAFSVEASSDTMKLLNRTIDDVFSLTK